MGRAPCCDKNGLKKGPWAQEEDQKLMDYIQKHGHGSWRTLPKNAGLARCGKSCRLRWTNYLRPDIKRGRFSFEEEETHHQNLRNEGENNNGCTINVTSLSTNQSQGTYTNEPNTSRQKSILIKVIQSLPINNGTSIYPTTLEAKSMLRIGFTGLIGLLSVSYKINGNGNIVPTALFHQPTITFTLLLIVFMVIFYLAAIGLVLEKVFPKITEVFKIISFVFLVLGATILLWALIPKNISWIPWIFFACTAAVVFGVLVLGRLTDKSSALKSTASRLPV